MPCLILPGGKLEWNVPYLKSIPGVLGIAEVVSCNISFRFKECCVDIRLGSLLLPITNVN